MGTWKIGVLVLLLVCGPRLAHGQEAELVTDRPGFSETSAVVGPGVVQFETGWSYERDGRGERRVSDVVVPAPLLRFGVSRRVELRVSTDGWISDRHAGVRVSGMADLETGMKIRIADQDRAGVDVAVIPILSWPTGSDGFSSGGVDPTMKLTFERELSSSYGLSGNYDVASISTGGDRFTQHAVSLSLERSLAENWSGFVETYGVSPVAPGARTGWAVDGGVTRAVGRDYQLDLEAGRALTNDATDWFVGFGFVIRGRLPRAH